MDIVLVGISHKTAPLDVREKFSFSDTSLDANYRALKNYHELSEALILSTCNRVELYGAGPDVAAVAGRLRAFLCASHGIAAGYMERYVYTKTGPEALEHLYRVTSGLDSMVIGEQQIMGQIKKAYSQACSNRSIGPYFHRAVQDALRIGKKTRSLTAISRGVTSIPGAVVEMVKREARIEDKKIFVIGAGKMGGMTVAKLAELAISEITVTNRDITRAEGLKIKRNVRIADIHTIGQEVERADIVIAATAAPAYLLDRAIVENTLRARPRGLLLIDLGVPRNIDEAVRTVEGVRLYNIDDLAPIIRETIRNRNLEAWKAQEIIQDEIAIAGAKAGDLTEGELCGR